MGEVRAAERVVPVIATSVDLVAQLGIDELAYGGSARSWLRGALLRAAADAEEPEPSLPVLVVHR